MDKPKAEVHNKSVISRQSAGLRRLIDKRGESAAHCKLPTENHPRPMPRIELKTEISAEIELVFDLSRSIDLHRISTQHTRETAIAGKTSGLLGLNESVTWRARHFGVYQHLTSKVTEFNPPIFFVDEMVSGAFASFRHEHHFADVKGRTMMTDIFEYRSPFGVLGSLADSLFLKRYMTELLTERNRIIKDFAESGRGRELLTQNPKSNN